MLVGQFCQIVMLSDIVKRFWNEFHRIKKGQFCHLHWHLSKRRTKKKKIYSYPLKTDHRTDICLRLQIMTSTVTFQMTLAFKNRSVMQNNAEVLNLSKIDSLKDRLVSFSVYTSGPWKVLGLTKKQKSEASCNQISGNGSDTEFSRTSSCVYSSVLYITALIMANTKRSYI